MTTPSNLTAAQKALDIIATLPWLRVCYAAMLVIDTALLAALAKGSL